MSRKELHKQVSFVDYFGNTVKVDKDLLFVLEAFRDFGVRTNFSCQGRKDHRAYIQTQGRTFFPLLKMIVAFYWKGLYSKSSRQLIKSFIRGQKDFHIVLFGETNHSFEFGTRHGEGYHSTYSIEFSISTTHGFRIVIRWPHLETPRLLRLLQETGELNSIKKKES